MADILTSANGRVPIDSLQPHPRNTRQGDIGAITQSLQQHGQYRPIVVQQSTRHIIAGNHTWKAAQALGWESISATMIDVDDEAALRILLVDNRTNDLASYDDHGLADLLVELAATPLQLAGTGFDGDDLDLLLADLNRDDNEDPPPIEVPSDPVTQPGDLWALDDHRVICGDAADPTIWTRVLEGYGSVNVAVTSPPYADRRPYDPASGFRPIPPDQYIEWIRPIVANIATHLQPDGSWFLNIKPGITPDGLDTELYVLELVLAHVREWGWHFATEFCWERNGVPKSVSQRFKNQFEPIYQFTRGRWKMRPDNVRHESENVPFAMGVGVGNTAWDGTGDLPGQGVGRRLPQEGYRKGRHGTRMLSDNQGTITGEVGETIGPGLAYPGNRLSTMAGSHQALGHAAAFPIGLPQFFIEAYTDQDDTTIDPMAGTGSTLIAAHNTGRIGLAIELSPAYCDVIIERYRTINPDAQIERID